MFQFQIIDSNEQKKTLAPNRTAMLVEKLLEQQNEMKKQQNEIQSQLQRLRMDTVLKKYKESMKNFFEQEKYTDCCLLVGVYPDKKLFKVHRLILAMASNVFETMLFGDWVEKSNPIKITAVQPLVFEAMLKYIYTGEVNAAIKQNSTIEEVRALYSAADKYQISSELGEACVEFLKKKALSPANACSLYEFSKKLAIPSLETQCMKTITSRTEDVLNSAYWCDIEFSTLLDILDQDKLNISSEVILFNAVIGYFLSRIDEEDKIKNDQSEVEIVDNPPANAQRNKFFSKLSSEDIENMQKAITKIRFLTMSLEEFVHEPHCLDVLSENDYLGIVRTLSRSHTGKIYYPTNFSKSVFSRSL